jgi:hypothetical protein
MVITVVTSWTVQEILVTHRLEESGLGDVPKILYVVHFHAYNSLIK